jgi:hypothetical protein
MIGYILGSKIYGILHGHKLDHLQSTPWEELAANRSIDGKSVGNSIIWWVLPNIFPFPFVTQDDDPSCDFLIRPWLLNQQSSNSCDETLSHILEPQISILDHHFPNWLCIYNHTYSYIHTYYPNYISPIISAVVINSSSLF